MGPTDPDRYFRNPAEVAFFRQGAQIVVLPNGTLVNAFYRILFDQKNLVVTFEQALFRSSDGKHWERMDIAVMASTPRRTKVPNEGQPRSFSSVRSVSD